MKILFAADGSSYTKKALAFLVTHENIAGPTDDIFVLNVQLAVPPRVKRMLGATAVTDCQREDADKVLAPIRRFLDRHAVPCRCAWAAGSPAAHPIDRPHTITPKPRLPPCRGAIREPPSCFTGWSRSGS